MDATCEIQDSIHVFSLVHKYVSRILGTYHYSQGFQINQIVQEMGLEPTRHCCHRHLKPARLPIPPLLQAKTIVSVLTREVKSKIKNCSNCSENR